MYQRLHRPSKEEIVAKDSWNIGTDTNGMKRRRNGWESDFKKWLKKGWCE